ncbi:hypothetical protein [Loktanella sp. M215]|uniref:hypothetical protein n=1 Tax=Loktanella sp. M215 TaxID=2675431 RepID=UPI001F252D02|nr:hypothetical protein [Loktanella sp. M215]MCF7702418.1 hypothetical protein [Loktanella sp. M215]
MTLSDTQNSTVATNDSSTSRDRVAKYIMIALGVSTLGAFANAAFELGSIPPDRIVSHTWEMLAYPVFAGLFALLAFYPRRMPGLWELVLFQKLGITFFSFSLLGSAGGAVASDDPMLRLIVDGVLVSLTLVSYGLVRGWTAWRDLH